MRSSTADSAASSRGLLFLPPAPRCRQGNRTIEFEEFGDSHAADIVSNAQALGGALSSEQFEDSRGEGVQQPPSGNKTRRDRLGAGRCCSNLGRSWNNHEHEHVTGRHKGTHPQRTQARTPELTRVGMKSGEMEDVARFFARLSLRGGPSSVEADVREFKSQFQTVHYCFGTQPAPRTVTNPQRIQSTPPVQCVRSTRTLSASLVLLLLLPGCTTPLGDGQETEGSTARWNRPRRVASNL